MQKSEVVLESCNNITYNKTISFKIPVTLWVYSKKVQTEALVDSGATTNCVDRVIMENNNLVTHKLANLYCVINMDSTPNKVGQITKYVQAYIEIRFHKTTQHFFVTNLENKEIMIGYSYLYKCQGRVERERSDPEWSGITLEWKGVDNKSGGTTLASAHVLCLDLLSHVWLRISGGLNCCQEFQRGVV